MLVSVVFIIARGGGTGEQRGGGAAAQRGEQQATHRVPQHGQGGGEQRHRALRREVAELHAAEEALPLYTTKGRLPAAAFFGMYTKTSNGTVSLSDGPTRSV